MKYAVVIPCPYCNGKITVSTNINREYIGACMEGRCPHCNKWYHKVYEPVQCLGCRNKCSWPKIIVEDYY